MSRPLRIVLGLFALALLLASPLLLCRADSPHSGSAPLPPITLAANPPPAATVAPAGASEQAPSDPDRFEPNIRRYERATAANPPAPGTAIVFIGSSTFTRWTTLAEDFPGPPVLNRGFGGSEFTDLLRYGERLLDPVRPAAVVIYCGGNDLARGTPPDTVAANAIDFISLVHRLAPEARVLLLGSKLAPRRLHLAEPVAALNTALAASVASVPRVRFLPTADLFLDAEGRPDPALFVADRLHLNAEGQSRLRDRLAPAIQELATAPAP